MQLSGREKVLFLQLFWNLVFWKLPLMLFPVGWFRRWIGEEGKESSFDPVNQELLLSQVEKAFIRAVSVVPWQSKCLTEAVATKRVLGKYKLSSTLYIGVARERERQAIAHAWLRCGQKIITGKKGHMNFTVVARFT